MSKLFGLFQVLFVLFLFLNTQDQCFAFELKLLYYHTGKCANYEFTCANGKCLSKWRRCRHGDQRQRFSRFHGETPCFVYISVLFPLSMLC